MMASQISNYQPDKDAGWGLIFRLNALWEKVDRKVLSGDYDGWELVLDRIFANLLYRNDMDLKLDDDERLINVQPSPEDVREWKIMKFNIKKAKTLKRKMFDERNNQKSMIVNERYYHSLFFYDIWVRKFMQKHQLYLKEIESNPSKALFGGAFKKRRN